MRHPVTGEIKELPMDEFFGLFDPLLHERIQERAIALKAEAIACFARYPNDEIGQRSAVCVGGNCCLREIDLERARLGDAEEFQYPVAIWRINE